METAYEVFAQELVGQGFYKRDYVYYGVYAFFSFLPLFVSLYVVTLTKNIYVQIGNGVFFGIILVQIGLLAHDLSHNQVFVSLRKNSIIATLVWGLIGGMSKSQWLEKHNAHHLYVNKIGYDSDLTIPFLFSVQQIKGRSFFLKKYILPYQHVLFFVALPFIYLQFVFMGFGHILTNITPTRIFELGLIAVHFLALVYFLFFFLPVAVAITFLVVSSGATGLYMSLVFAPNHKGKPVIEENESVSWINQITSTRNVGGSFLVFQAFGGLNFQIEHHLFPTMARTGYFKVQRKVKAFCEKENLEYDEVTWVQSLKDIYSSLKKTAETTEANQTQMHQHQTRVETHSL